MAPTILFVPGFWEGSSPFTHVSSILKSEGFSAETAVLPSTGTTSPGNPGMHDDVAAIRSTVEKLVSAEQDVVMVCHSAGGFLGSNAIDGLGRKSRAEKGLKGGVSTMVFLTGALFPQGFKHGPLPFFVINGGAMTCVTPSTVLFNDLDPDSQKKWTDALQTQPAEGWDDIITYCGWKDISSTYLVCEGDAVIPPPMQVQIAEMANCKIEKCGAVHMTMLSMPEKVVDVIKNAAAATAEA